jgi:hypothetical protein
MKNLILIFALFIYTSNLAQQFLIKSQYFNIIEFEDTLSINSRKMISIDYNPNDYTLVHWDVQINFDLDKNTAEFHLSNYDNTYSFLYILDILEYTKTDEFIEIKFNESFDEWGFCRIYKNQQKIIFFNIKSDNSVIGIYGTEYNTTKITYL